MTAAGGPRRWPLLVSVFLVSFSVLAFEVSLTRVFSALLSYHYAFLAVSGAVCGLGMGGLGWHVLGEARGDRRLEAGWAALGFAITMPVSLLLLFGATALLSGSLWATLIILLPFACAGAFLAEVFRQQAGESGRLYQADLGGAAIAAVVIVPLVGLTGALDLVFLLGGIAALAAAWWAAFRGSSRLMWVSCAVGCVLFLAWPLSARGSLLRLRPFVRSQGEVAKLLIRDLAKPGFRPIVVDSEWTAYARTDLMRYPLPEYSAYTLQLFTDGETPSNMTPFKRDLKQITFLQDDLPYLAFDISPHRKMLSIGPGGGMDFLWGLLAGFEQLEGVEINDSVARLMDRYQKVNGDLYHYRGVRVTVEDGRSYIRRSTEQYDLITTSLTQTATTGNVGLALVESYIHTQEAFEDYYRHLGPEGRYALVGQADTVVLRGALTAISVMEDHGVPAAEACRHLMVLGLAGAEDAPTPYRYLLVWKKTPLTEADLAPARMAVEAGWAVALYLPGAAGDSPLHRIARGELTPEQVFATGLTREGVRINIAPATDDRPFFLDLSFDIPGVLEWLLLGSLALAVGYSAVLLLRRKGGGRGVRPWVLYFSVLGVGFMLVEIPLIQKLVLFLGHPTISLAAILFYLLTGASMGSRISQGWGMDALPRRAAVASLLVALMVLAYLFALAPLLNAFQASPRVLRLALLGVIVLPLGVVLGVPFPSGIRLMAGGWQGEIPWMWGVNGMMSVVGSTLAAASAKFIGFSGCLLAGAVIYLCVAVGLARARAVPAAAQDARPRSRRQAQPDAPGLEVAPPRPRRPGVAILLLLAAAAVSFVWAVGLDRSHAEPPALPGCDWSPLHRAAFRGDIDRAQKLLAAGADVNLHSVSAYGWTPLHEAVFVGHEEVTRLLLQRGANPNAADERGRTPLHTVAPLGDTAVAKLLLDAGADANARDQLGETPLHAAASMGHAELIQLLVGRGAEVNARATAGMGWTPFTAAVLRRRFDAANLLLKFGADINARDNDGRTALHITAWTGQTEIVEYLLAHGADTEVRDNEGKTALELAEERENQEVVELLRSRGERR